MLCQERRVVRSIEKRQKEESWATIQYRISIGLIRPRTNIYIPEGCQGDDAAAKNMKVGQDLRVIEVVKVMMQE
jgi:hypothetical protein